MKTRPNHRKTTSRRRRRVVKQQRIQTRIHRRKKTAVSSRRRHYFFKRGGGKEDDVINIIIRNIENTVKTKLGIASNDDSMKLDVIKNDTSPSKEIHEPTIFQIDDNNIKAVIVEPKQGYSGQSVYMFINNNIYCITITFNTETMSSYDKGLAAIIFNAINLNKDLNVYKTT